MNPSVVGAGPLKEPKNKKRVKRIVIGSIALFLGLAALFAFVIYPNLPDPGVAGDVNDTTVRDTRSDATKDATTAADTQSGSGDVAGAYVTLDAAIAKTKSTDIENLLSLYQTKAVIATNAGQKDVAVDAQNKAIALSPNDPKLVETLGEIYGHLGDTDNANAAFKKAEALAADKGSDSYHGVGPSGTTE